MTPTVSIDTTEFQSAIRQMLAKTSRTLPQFLNARMFYLLLRMFAALDPKDPQAERNRIRNYLNEPVGERRFDKRTGKKVSKIRSLQRRHLIAQAKNAQAGNAGLYGEAMKSAAAKLSRWSIGSVGYLKSTVARAIKKINGHFTQFGYTTKKHNGRQVAGNAALIAMANQYGLALGSNVGMHKGSRAYVKKAVAGFNPSALADMSLRIADGQEGRVTSRMNAAAATAFRDETIEMQRHLARQMQDLANEHMEKPL